MARSPFGRLRGIGPSDQHASILPRTELPPHVVIESPHHGKCSYFSPTFMRPPDEQSDARRPSPNATNSNSGAEHGFRRERTARLLAIEAVPCPCTRRPRPRRPSSRRPAAHQKRQMSTLLRPSRMRSASTRIMAPTPCSPSHSKTSSVTSSTPLSRSTLGRRPIPLAMATTLLSVRSGLGARVQGSSDHEEQAQCLFHISLAQPTAVGLDGHREAMVSRAARPASLARVGAWIAAADSRTTCSPGKRGERCRPAPPEHCGRGRPDWCSLSSGPRCSSARSTAGDCSSPWPWSLRRSVP